MEYQTGFVCGERAVSKVAVQLKALKVAQGLHEMGVGAGDCVALLMRNDIPFFEISYGVMMLGAYPLPINWHFSVSEIDYLLKDSGAKVLFSQSDLARNIESVIAVPTVLVQVAHEARGLHRQEAPGPHYSSESNFIDYERWVEQYGPFNGEVKAAPQSIFYTSGTTGVPKGVRRNAPNPAQIERTRALRSRVYNIREGARALVAGPLYHGAPNVFGLENGRTGEAVVIMERFDAEECLRLIQNERIDTIFMVPTMFTRLLKLPEATRSKYDVSSLRHVIHAAAPCPPGVKQAMIDWWGPVINEFYGSTEALALTYITSEESLRKRGSVGRALPGVHISIFDNDGNPVAATVHGEIYSRQENFVDFTYHDAPAERAEIERNSWITQGDVGYLDEEGYLFICDRKRDMVISGGVNIYPAEIESQLHAMEKIGDCAVFGIPDAEFGESLIALIEPAPGAVVKPDEIRAFLKSRLASYKVPGIIEIRDQLPRDDSGKIYKRLLREPYWAGAARQI